MKSSGASAISLGASSSSLGDDYHMLSSIKYGVYPWYRDRFFHCSYFLFKMSNGSQNKTPQWLPQILTDCLGPSMHPRLN